MSKKRVRFDPGAPTGHEGDTPDTLRGMTIDAQELNRRIGATVRQAREARGWSQQDLSDAFARSGVSTARALIGRSEAGTRPFTLPEIIALEDALGLSPQALLMGRSLSELCARMENMHEAVYLQRRELTRQIQEVDKASATLTEGMEALKALGGELWQRGDITKALAAIEVMRPRDPAVVVLRQALGISDEVWRSHAGDDVSRIWDILDARR